MGKGNRLRRHNQNRTTEYSATPSHHTPTVQLLPGKRVTIVSDTASEARRIARLMRGDVEYRLMRDDASKGARWGKHRKGLYRKQGQ